MCLFFFVYVGFKFYCCNLRKYFGFLGFSDRDMSLEIFKLMSYIMFEMILKLFFVVIVGIMYL